MISGLGDYDDITLFERRRSDLIIKERNFSMNELFKLKVSSSVDMIIQGKFLIDEKTQKFSVKITTIRIGKTNSISETYTITIDTISPENIIFYINKFFLEPFIKANKIAKKINDLKTSKVSFGSKIAITGFNNYSELTKYDSLQKGIIYLIEERLKQNKSISILDRQHLKKIYYEQLLKQFSNHNQIPDNLAAADLLITGCFTFFNNKFFISCRLIDVNTTEIKCVYHYESEMKTISKTIGIIIDQINFSLSKNSSENIIQEKIYPSSVETLLYYSRGVELFDKNDFLQAVEYMDRAISIEPSYTFGKWQAGKIYEEYLMNYSKAVEAYKKVLADASAGNMYEKSLLRIAMINYKYLKNYTDCIYFLSEFKNKFPNSEYNDIIYFTCGHSLQMLEKYSEALENYSQIINSKSFTPIIGSFYIRAGECSLLLKKTNEAKTYFKTAAEEHPDEIYKAETGGRNIYVGEEAQKYLSGMR